MSQVGTYLFTRVLSEGKDSRFDEIKPYPAKFSAAFIGQAAWVSFCLMPVMALNSVPGPALAATTAFGLTDALGLAIWAGGFACEVIADRQKSQWLHEKRTKQHDEEFLTRGLFGKRYVKPVWRLPPSSEWRTTDGIFAVGSPITLAKSPFGPASPQWQPVSSPASPSSSH